MRVFGIAGYSGSGKTTLIGRIIVELKKINKTVSVIKHAHHEFDIDQPGKDSYKHRKAGACEVLVSSSRRWALIHELEKEDEPTIGQLLNFISKCDIVLVEGFKNGLFPKLEVCREGAKTPLLFKNDQTVKAIATDYKIETALPVFGITDYTSIAKFVHKEAVNSIGLK